MRASATTRLRLAFAVLAWLAQAFMPVAHAAFMGASRHAPAAWCGDPAAAQVALALLPAELRTALDDGSVNADHIAHCALLCAAGSAPPLAPSLSPSAFLRAPGVEPTLFQRCCPSVRSQSPLPPAHAPPQFA